VGAAYSEFRLFKYSRNFALLIFIYFLYAITQLIQLLGCFMGLLDGLLGNASEIDVDEVAQELAPIIGEGESVVQVFKLVRDMFVFTDKRLILIDKQGMTGRKVDYHSVPYRAITQFKIETAGHFDLDAELKIWVSGQSEPIEKELSKAAVVGVQKTLATQIFG
jgi:hypothetical protein